MSFRSHTRRVLKIAPLYENRKSINTLPPAMYCTIIKLSTQFSPGPFPASPQPSPREQTTDDRTAATGGDRPRRPDDDPAERDWLSAAREGRMPSPPPSSSPSSPSLSRTGGMNLSGFDTVQSDLPPPMMMISARRDDLAKMGMHGGGGGGKRDDVSSVTSFHDPFSRPTTTTTMTRGGRTRGGGGAGGAKGSRKCCEKNERR